MPLPTLSQKIRGLPKLVKFAIPKTKLPNITPSEQKDSAATFAEKYAPYPPFNSSWEVYTWEWLNTSGNQIKHQWETQATFGIRGGKGSTRVDFLSRVLMIAWYLDGAYWHIGNKKEAEDPILRAQVAARGFRVVSWVVSSEQQLQDELPQFYRDMVFRGRSK